MLAEIEGGGAAAQRSGSPRWATSRIGRELVEWATEAGDGCVDILIDNAGVAVLGPSNAATEAEFDESFAVNVKIPFFLVASLAPAMAERGWGSRSSTSPRWSPLRKTRQAWLCTAPAGRLSNC